LSLARKFWSLTWGERRLAIAAGCVVLTVRVGLWLLGFRAVHGLVLRAGPSARLSRRAPHSIPRITGAVGAVSRFVPRATCLTQALAAHWLLSREGYAPSLRLGVRRDESDFQAHAWVECDGSVVIGGTDARIRYRPLPLSNAEAS